MKSRRRAVRVWNMAQFLMGWGVWAGSLILTPSFPPTQADWVAWKAGAWKTVKHEAHHYWVGTKLLWLDMKIASRLAVKAGRGLELTRCGAEMHCTRGGG